MDIRTPCHGAALLIMCVNDGDGYGFRTVPDEIMCAEPTCINIWDITGTLKNSNIKTEPKKDSDET
jgi:hypothetical protein